MTAHATTRCIAAGRQAARASAAAVEPFASGVYVNDLADEGRAGIRRAYHADQLARLTALKDHHDPDNVFHLNHNIRPAGLTRAARPPGRRLRPGEAPARAQQLCPGPGAAWHSATLWPAGS